MRKTLLAVALALAPTSALAATDGPVVRPQLYTANEKFEIAAVVGYVSNDPYHRVVVPGVIASYHYGDRSAIEVHAGYQIYTEKQLMNQVVSKIGRRPNVVSRPQYFVTANYSWTPIYGKLNAFGEIVLHYDFYLLAGAGVVGDEIEVNSGTAGAVTQTIQQKVFPVTDFAFGQHFFLSKRTAIRAELRPYIFWEQINNKWDPNGDVQILLGFSLIL